MPAAEIGMGTIHKPSHLAMAKNHLGTYYKCRILCPGRAGRAREWAL